MKRALIASEEKPAAARGPRQAAEGAITNVQARRDSPAGHRFSADNG